MTDDLIVFMLWLGATLIVLGLATGFEHIVCWALGIDDPVEEHAEKPNGL